MKEKETTENSPSTFSWGTISPWLHPGLGAKKKKKPARLLDRAQRQKVRCTSIRRRLDFSEVMDRETTRPMLSFPQTASHCCYYTSNFSLLKRRKIYWCKSDKKRQGVAPQFGRITRTVRQLTCSCYSIYSAFSGSWHRVDDRLAFAVRIRVSKGGRFCFFFFFFFWRLQNPTELTRIGLNGSE